MTALARRAVASKHWRWMPGMRNDYNSGICVDASDPGDLEDGDVGLVRWTRGHWKCTDYLSPDPGHYPDLDDPATLGCLLALVREAWGDPAAITSPDGCDWGVSVSTATPDQVMDGWDTMVAFGDTEAEALVAALEAAP